MTIGKHGGMSSQGDGTIVKSVNSLSGRVWKSLTIKNDGVEFRSENNTYSMEAIVKGKILLSSACNSNDRFTKYAGQPDNSSSK